ncbi:MAG: 4-hydroxythreonine-4-phosphate dehydrogenase PdxA [Proteobacteria bacterium]|nr:4-hydroxythreonine-4-phosphate dehydrogenase PdxA [Pseudomonadota bacterium]
MSRSPIPGSGQPAHRLSDPKTARIGLTLGDPSGIGPEIVAFAVSRASRAVRSQLMLFGDGPIVERAFAQVTGQRVPADVEVVDRGLLSADQAVLGRPSEAGARAQVGYLEAAVSAIKSHAIAGLVTAPISKHEARKAGFSFPGHTEFLAERLGAERVAMMFAGPTINAVLATTHVPLAGVSRALSRDDLAATIVLAVRAMQDDFGRESVRVGVVGLNPHAGENGMIGAEEIEIIAPAIERARRQLGPGISVSGPLVPDAAFRAAVDGVHDLVVAMYHDQALIPVKLIDFERAVNVTLGLPIVRTSPDHGVAYDLAGTGKARPESFCAALDLALDLVERRSQRAAASGPTDPATDPAPTTNNDDIEF